MRLSFVQRLKNEKKDTVPTRQSQQKVSPSRRNINQLSQQKPKHNHHHDSLKKHHHDLKDLLCILQETKNPQSRENIPNFSQKSKAGGEKQFFREITDKSQRKQNKGTSKQNTQKQSNFLNSSRKVFEHRKNQIIYEQLVRKQTKLIHSIFEDENNFEDKLDLKQMNQISPSKSNCFRYQFPKARNQIKLSPLNINKTLNEINLLGSLKQVTPQRKKNQQNRFVKRNQDPYIRKDIPISKQNKNEIQIRSPARLYQKGQNIIKQKRGLQNIGNTCYINSIIQCLFHINSFNQYFEREGYLKQNLLQINKQKFDSDKSIVLKYRELYLFVMKGINCQKKDETNPYSNEQISTYSLKFLLSRTCSLYLDWHQQDSHEFMRKLLDSMHQQLNRGDKLTPYKLLKTKTKLKHSSISSLANQYVQYYKQRDDSYIYDSFGGQIYNNVTCINCKNQSISFDNCLDISLPLVKGMQELEVLLDDYFGEEKLNDYYRCEYCQQINKNSVKITKFWKTPQILIIHLKRSQFGKKNQQPIKIPLDLLSLKNFMCNQSDKISQRHSNYTLKGIVCHKGVIQGGHYWSLVKQFAQWYQIDDQNVVKKPQSQIKQQFQILGSSEPYILFYSSMNK